MTTMLAAVLAALQFPMTIILIVAGIIAVVVCHDAMGVRLETGKQATILNEMIKTVELFASEKLPEVKLKEFVGHTPSQVAAGVMLGIVNSLIVYNAFLK